MINKEKIIVFARSIGGIKIFMLLFSAVVSIWGMNATIAVAQATQKGYTISASSTRVYSNSSLNTGIGWIYSTDEVTLNSIGNKIQMIETDYRNKLYRIEEETPLLPKDKEAK